jgi:hypothetical protein
LVAVVVVVVLAIVVVVVVLNLCRTEKRIVKKE